MCVLVLVFCFTACLPSNEKIKKEYFGEVSFYLQNKGETMPVYVMGNLNTKKILLILHGGPGGNMTEYAHLKALTDEFLIVGFEQRGNDYCKGVPAPSVKLADIASDFKLLIREIQMRYQGDLYVYAGSFGAFVLFQYLSGETNIPFRAAIVSMGVTYSPQIAMQKNLARIKFEATQKNKHLSAAHTPFWENLAQSVDSVQMNLINNGDWLEFETANNLCLTAEKLLLSVYLEPRSISQIYIQSVFTTNYSIAKQKALIFQQDAKYWRRSDSTYFVLAKEWLKTNQKQALSKIKIPILFIHGAQDVRVCPDAVEEQLKNLSGQVQIKYFSYHAHNITEAEIAPIKIFLREN